MLRAIREIQPRWIVGENVRGLVNWSGGLVFEQVQADLEAQGYKVQPFILPACAKDAPHRRDRIWFVAYGEARAAGGNTSNDRGKGNLEDAIAGLLPTPASRDWKGARSKEALNEAGRTETNSLCDAFSQPGKTSQLNPRFCLEMMGFPTDYLELPFLSGETNQLKEPATQSCHK